MAETSEFLNYFFSKKKASSENELVQKKSEYEFSISFINIKKNFFWNTPNQNSWNDPSKQVTWWIKFMQVKKKTTGVEFASNINPFQMEIMVLQKVNYVVLYFILKLNVLKKYPQHKLVLYTTFFSIQLCSPTQLCSLHNFVLYITLCSTQL